MNAPANLLVPGPAEATTLSKQTCTHCGTEFKPSRADENFCCTGCAFVHEMISGEGLDRFYELKGTATTRPVENVAFEQLDHAWLREAVTRVEENPPNEPTSPTTQACQLDVGLDGASCAGCVWLIERLYQQEPGTLRILVDALQGRLEMHWESGQFDALAFAEKLQQFGYTLCPLDQRHAQQRRDPLIQRLGLCAAFAMNGMAFTLPRYLGMPADFMFAGLFQLITALSATLALAVGGSYFIRRAWQALKQGVIHVDVPIALGIVLAYTGSLVGWLLGLESMLYFDFVAIFVFLMLGGRWIQEQAMRRNRRSLFEREAIPKTVLVDGEALATTDLQLGQAYELQPNQVVPVASRILSPSLSLGMEWIQGESETHDHREGAVAPSGAIHRGHAPAQLEARETWTESLLHRLTENQENHQEHPFLQRVLQIYLIAVLGIGLLGCLFWSIQSGDLAKGLQVALSIFVISCPCALGIAIPLADEAAAATARQLGVFVQQLSIWARLRRVRKVLFDKTGTLTLDTPHWKNPEVVESLSPRARSVLAGMVTTSSHPVSRSLTQGLLSQRIPIEKAVQANIEEQPGRGLLFTDTEGHRWELTKPNVNEQADTTFRRDGKTLASFQFEDRLRPGAAEEIEQLERAGLATHILSGDRTVKVAALAHDLGLARHQWKAEMSPDAKAEQVRHLDEQDTLFIGDGVNDSLAFDEAYATATPAFDRNLLTKKADCYFVTQGLTFLNPLLRLARRRQHLIRGVFTFTATYNAAAIVVCLMGLMNPLLAAILMPLSSIATTSMVAIGMRQQ